VIAEIHKKLAAGTKPIKGVLVENKGLSETVHYRMIDEKDLPRLRGIFEEIVGFYLSSGRIKTAENKKTLEVLPNTEWDKGKMVLKLSGSYAGGDALPVYVGDDRTDEDAFKAVKKCGIPILVSETPKRSHARYYLKDADEVVRFLEMLPDLH